MTLTGYAVWFLNILAVWVVVALFSFLLLKKCKSSWFIPVFMLFDLLTALTAAYLAVASDSWLTWYCNEELVAVYIVMSANFAATFIDFLCCMVKDKKREKPARRKLVISLILTILLSVYGTINMQVVSPSVHTYYSNKLTGDHIFAVVVDLHVGSSQSFSTVKKTLYSVAASSPEFIVLAGDITDEFTTKEEMEETYRIIGSLQIPVYFIYGNHDRQENSDINGARTYTDEELVQTIQHNGITILDDEIVLIGNDLSLMGREDVSSSSRAGVLELPARDEARYQITIDHQPYATEDIVAQAADLQISGHAHAGQYFPLEQVYNLAGYDAYGEYRYGSTDLLVSAGAAGWMVPFRTARNCNYEIVYLKMEK